MERNINIEYGFKTTGNVTSWIFWLNDDRLVYSNLRLAVNKAEKAVKFIEGSFDLLLKWQGTEALFNILKTDWFFKAFPNPQYLLTQELFALMVCGEITNPMGLAEHILKESGCKNLITPRMFYKNILRNDRIRFDEEGDLIFMLLRVASNPIKATAHICELIEKYSIAEYFYELVNTADDLSEKIDLFWSDTRVVDELDYLGNLRLGVENTIESVYLKSPNFNSKVKNSGISKTIKINYTGKPILPESCSLICDSRSLHKEEKKMSHCVASYWQGVLHRESFIIHMEQPDQATFEIKRTITGWYSIGEVSGISNTQVSEKAMIIMNRFVSMMQNQLFFFKNSCFNTNEFGKRPHFLADPTLHDEVFEPDGFKYKMINSILT